MLFNRLLTQLVLTAVAALALAGAAGTWQLQQSTKTPSSAPAGPVRLAPNHRNSLGQTPVQPPIRLPADRNAVVIRMDRSVDSSKVPGTRLTVFADGRVVVEVPEGLNSLAAQDLTRFVNGQSRAGNDRKVPGVKLLEGKLSAVELEELVRFAIQEEEFLTFDPAAVKAAIWDEYQSDWTVEDNTDATTTAFMVQTADHKHEVSWPRLGKSIWNFPRIRPLRHLRGLEQRLAHVSAVLQAGGAERVDAVVAKLDALLLRYYFDHPLIPNLTAEDLANVTPMTDRKAVLYAFVRQDANFDFTPLFAASILVPQQGEPSLYSLILPK